MAHSIVIDLFSETSAPETSTVAADAISHRR